VSLEHIQRASSWYEQLRSVQRLPYKKGDDAAAVRLGSDGSSSVNRAPSASDVVQRSGTNGSKSLPLPQTGLMGTSDARSPRILAGKDLRAIEAASEIDGTAFEAKPLTSRDSEVLNGALPQHTLYEHKEGAGARHNQWNMKKGNDRQWRWCHAPYENAYNTPLESCVPIWHLHSLTHNGVKSQYAPGHADGSSRSLTSSARSTGICSILSSDGSLSAGEQGQVVVTSTLSEQTLHQMPSAVVQNVCDPRPEQHVDASDATSNWHMSLSLSERAAESPPLSEPAQMSSTMVRNVCDARAEHVDAAAEVPCTGMWGQVVPAEALAGLFKSVADALLATLQHVGVADGAKLAFIRVADGERPGVTFLNCSAVYALKVQPCPFLSVVFALHVQAIEVSSVNFFPTRRRCK
jgi:hypothetical protein